jgi:hypothetical protein
MPVERLRTRHLSSDERADLESALKTAGNYFFESRRLITLSLVCVAAWLMVAEVGLMYQVRESYRSGGPLRFFEGFVTGLPESLLFLLEPEFLLFVASVALPVVILALVVHAWRTDEQCYALTSFGLVRMRGSALRLVRYPDVAETRVGRGWSFARFASTDKLEVLARDGTCLVVHGYGLAEWKSLIDARRSPADDTGSRRFLRGRAADTDSKRSA